MAKIPVLDAVRIIPRDSNFLNRKMGSIGEIFYDRDTDTLRLYDGKTLGGVKLAKADLTNVSNATFLAKAADAGVGGSGGNSTVSVSAEDSTINQATSGIIKFNGLAGIAVTTAPTGIVNIIGPGVASTVAAGVVKVDGTSITITNGVISTVAQSLTSLGFAAGVTINEFSNDQTFTDNSASAVPTESAVRNYIDRRLGNTHSGATVSTGDLISERYATQEFVTNLIGNFSDLPDATAASLTIDEIYLPAITMLVVSNIGATSYRFDQYGSSDNPTIYAINGTTIAFKLNASGHPFQIQTPGGINYNTGLIHVSTSGVVSTGVAAQGKDSGTLYWKIPTDISGGYRYQSSLDVSMVGSLTVKTFSTL